MEFINDTINLTIAKKQCECSRCRARARLTGDEMTKSWIKSPRDFNIAGDWCDECCQKFAMNIKVDPKRANEFRTYIRSYRDALITANYVTKNEVVRNRSKQILSDFAKHMHFMITAMKAKCSNPLDELNFWMEARHNVLASANESARRFVRIEKEPDAKTIGELIGTLLR